MPKWGVTEEDLVQGLPWGLSADLLRPAKTITDPVHGDIYVNRLEQLIIDSPPMQRLRRVRQLGTTHLVYPGATHSRFSHALGTLRAAQNLLDAVADNRRVPGHVPDLLDEWAETGPDELTRRFAEATVLARLGGLMHDLCHVPLGHTIEDDLKVLRSHDSNEARFDLLWAQLGSEGRRAIEAASGLKTELRHLILSKIDMGEDWRSVYPFVEDIVGNTICADLMDYLSRDHHHAGLPMQIGHRFVDHFYVMPSSNVRHPMKMIIRTTRKGQQRQDIKTELEKYLRYRYELTERVLTHHAKTSADAMIGKLLEMWSDETWLDKAAEQHQEVLANSRNDSLETIKKRIGALSPETVEVPHGRDADGSRRTRKVPATVHAVDTLVRSELEAEFTSRSDDGMLEHLQFTARTHAGNERWEGIGALAGAVLDRRLFKRAARADSPEDLSAAIDTYSKFGLSDARRELELSAARFAGVKPGWKVVIWLPDPTMRLKLAEVLVDTGKGVATLDSLSGPSKQIVDAHKALWATTIYVEPELRKERSGKVLAMLAFLRDVLDLALHDTDGKAVRGCLELARGVVAEANRLNADQVNKLDVVMRQTTPAAAGGSGTFDTLVVTVWQQAADQGLTTPEMPPGHWSTWGSPGGA